MSRVRNWFFSTWLGEQYFNFLLWRDRRADQSVRFLTPQEAVTITRQYSLLYRGVEEVKKEVNKLVNAKTAAEYDNILKGVENMMDFASRAEDSPEARFAQVIRAMKVKKGNRDIVTHTDQAKMVQDRIGDYKDLQDHVVKRTLMRQIRKARQADDKQLLAQLEQEWKEKYGR